MEDLFESFPEDIKSWEKIKDFVELEADDELQNDDKSVSSVQLLPRQKVMMYGLIPKMEQRIYVKCKECRLVFNPRDILSHKICPGKSHNYSSNNLKKKVKSKTIPPKKTKKKTNLPPQKLFKKSAPSTSTPPLSLAEIPKVSSSKISKSPTTSGHSTITTTTSSSSKSEVRVSSSTSKSSTHLQKSPSKPTTTSAEHSQKSKSTSTSGESNPCSSSSSSKHKKNRKSTSSSSSTKLTKEFDPDIHCGVVEGNRGPCTRSITCSNHRIQLRKLVTGRSKDIHQLIAERKTLKEKELKPTSNCSYMSPNGQAGEKGSFSPNTTFVPAVAAIANVSEPPDTSTLIPAIPNINEATIPAPARQTTSNVAVQPVTETENPSVKIVNNNYILNMHSPESDIGTVPVVYMPMNLISFVQIGDNYICLESPQSAQTTPPITTQSLLLTIPNVQRSNMKSYKTLPKPVAVPNYGAKKMGGAILLSTKRLECQRNEIMMAITPKRKTLNNTQNHRNMSVLNHTNTPHRPNILKVKSVNKVNCKRTATDKLSTCDSKQSRLTKIMGTFCPPI
ncbi:uncharacterized protein [Diabrotica undecimpunctata]|uniref:uncharacterized protein n=1 Tax=Diabrotica undecimpunctata TaxID=50387 RepID=UPI003B632AAD